MVSKLDAIAQRSNLSLAAQILYQCDVLALLRQLAREGDGARLVELLRDPVKLADAPNIRRPGRSRECRSPR